MPKVKFNRCSSFFIMGYSFILTIFLSWRILLTKGAISCNDWNISPHSLHIFNELKRSLFTWFYSGFLYGFGREQAQLFQLNLYGILSFLSLFFKDELLSKAFLFLTVFSAIYFFSLLFEYLKIPRVVYLVVILYSLLTPFYINMMILGALGHLLNVSFFILDFYLIERYVKKQKFYLLILLIFSWMITPIFISIVIFFIFILRIFWENFVFTRNFHNFILDLKKAIYMLLIFIFLQAYWILQLICQFFSIRRFSTFDFSSHIFLKYSPLDLFSLSHFWAPFYENIIYKFPLLLKSYFIFINILLPTISLGVILFLNLKNSQYVKKVLFFLILFISLLSFPFLVYIWEFEPILYFYRDMSSIYTLILIIESLLLAFFLKEIYLKKRLIFWIVFIFFSPYVIFFIYNGRFLDLRTISKEENYILADKWIAKKYCADFKVIWFPTGTFYIESGLKDGSWCSDFWSLYSSVPGSISDINYRHTFIYKFGYEILKKFYTKDIIGIKELLKLSCIKYIIVRMNRENNQWALPSDRTEWRWKVKEVYKSLRWLNFPLEKQYKYVKIFKNEDFLPHIYLSPFSTLSNCNINSFIYLAWTKYLNFKPVLIFQEENRKKEIIDLLKNNENFVLKDLNFQDLVIQFIKKEKVEIERPEICEIFVDAMSFPKKILYSFKVKINDKEAKFFKLSQKFHSKYVKIAEFKVEKPKKIKIEIINENLKLKSGKVKIVLVNKKERERLEKEIWRKINNPKTELCYIFEKEKGEFFVN